MGFGKEEKKPRRWKLGRGIKTVFFLITMSISFLVFSGPLLLVLADILLPSALLSSSLPSSLLSFQSLSSHLRRYDFRSSLFDIPILSISRSLIILCVYELCDGHKISDTLYLEITMICSVSSLIFVMLKASFTFRDSNINKTGIGLIICSSVLAIGHLVVAYRTSCRQRRKLLVYKIDVEAVSGFSKNQKILKEQRVK